MSRRIDFDSKKVSEAFRAGNRARKKESAADTVESVESVDDMQAQIDLFKKQTGIELEIRDGHPYLINGMWLADKTGLTGLPTGLKINGGLYLMGCTGLTRLPDGLEVGGDLNLRGCTGLTGLPFDLIVQGKWIKHDDILTPFFRKLRIPVDKDGDTLASYWHRWQKAHGYLSEAFKAGNKARKKESVQDAIEGVDIQVTKKTCTETVEKLAKSGRFSKIGINDLLVHVMSDTAAEIGGFDKVELLMAIQGHGFWEENTLWTEVKSDTGWFPDIYIGDGVNYGEYEPGGICYIWFTNKRTPGEPVAWHRITPYSRWIIYDRFVDIIKDIIIRARRENIPAAVNEAFKAGNRARKKETAQDTVGIFDDLLITPDRVRDYIGTDIQSVEKMCTNGSWRELINRLLSEVFEKPHSNVHTYTKHENGVSISTYYYTGRESHIMVSGNNGYVMRLRVDGEGHPDKFTVGITFYDRGVRCLRGRGGDKEYETVLERDNWRRDDGYEFNDEGLLMFCQFLSTGIVPAGFAVKDVVLDEAFKAGNRARKKESVQDTVESVDSIQAQIDLFKEQTGEELEIRDGHPYYDGNLDLSGCTELTRLPAGLKVNGYLSLNGCTGLTDLPADLSVIRGGLDLTNCTKLTSLPADLKVEGGLYLRGCTGLTSLPDGLKVRGMLNLQDCTRLTSLPFDLYIQDFWIIHGGILTPFFNKLGIPVNGNGDTLGSDWRKWQKAHGYLTEAFKAGNRARKKEDIQDTVDSIDDIQAQIDLFKKQTGVKLEIKDGRPYFNGDLNLVDCTGLTSLPEGLKVNGRLDLDGCTGLTSLPAGLEVNEDLALNYCTGLTDLPFDLIVHGYWIEHKRILTPFFRKLGIRVNRIEYTMAKYWRKWQKAHGYLTEAFRAGNRARKKESVQDAVESVDDIQLQIDLFKKQTGIELEIRDGRPYFDGFLNLGGCAKLTSLPANLKVEAGMNLEDCTKLTSLPAGLKVGGSLDLSGCTGLTVLPSDLVVQGVWIKHNGILKSFFRKLRIPVDDDGDTRALYWYKWQEAHRHLTEAFKAGNRARKKESIQDAAAVTDSVNLSFMDTIGEIESFLCRRGEQEDRVMTAEGDAIDSGKWFDWRGRTEDFQALVIEVENIDGDTCNVYVYVDATGVPSTFDATGQHRMDFECTKSLSNRAVLNNVLNIFDRLAGPAGEDELPEDLREGDENWEIYKNLTQRHADFLRPFLCKQDLDRLIVDGVLDEAFKAGNRARKKESAQDTAESADRPVTFDESLGEIERLIHRIGSKYKKGSHNNLYSKQRPEAQAEIFHIHPFSSNELTDNDVSRDGFYPGGWSEKVTHSYDAVVDLAYFPELDRTFVMMCANVCTVDPGDIRHMSVFNRAGSYSEYYMGDYTDKDPLRDTGDYDLMGSEFFYPVDTVSDLGRTLEIVTYMLTDKRWLACMALFTVCRSFSSQYTRNLLPGAICPYIRKDIRISPEMLHSAVNGALWNELLVKSNGLCGAIVDGRFTYKEILDMFEPDEYRSESGQPKVLW